MQIEDDDGSVTRWISDLKAGLSENAAQGLWGHYFDKLRRLARSRLQSRSQAVADDEDVALEVFESVCRGLSVGRFPDIRDRDDLWKLLATVTGRRASNQVRDQRREKRGGGRVVSATSLAGPNPDTQDALMQFVDDGPTPDFSAMVLDEYVRLFTALDDESLRLVALLKLEGYQAEQIALSLDCSVRTVERKLEQIRKTWEGELQSE